MENTEESLKINFIYIRNKNQDIFLLSRKSHERRLEIVVKFLEAVMISIIKITYFENTKFSSVYKVT